MLKATPEIELQLQSMQFVVAVILQLVVKEQLVEFWLAWSEFWLVWLALAYKVARHSYKG